MIKLSYRFAVLSIAAAGLCMAAQAQQSRPSIPGSAPPPEESPVQPAVAPGQMKNPQLPAQANPQYGRGLEKNPGKSNKGNQQGGERGRGSERRYPMH